MCLSEGGASVADGGGHEFHLSPHHFESYDEWGVLGGLLLMPFVAPEVLAKSDLDGDEAALFCGRKDLGPAMGCPVLLWRR